MSAVDISTMPADERARRAWIKYQLELRGYTLGGIARQLGVGRTTVRTAIIRPYPRMERTIARILGVDAAAIWPERYAAREAGRPMRSLHSTHTSNVTQPDVPANGKEKGAV